MSWFAASVILHIQFKDGVQDKFPFWEDVFLIQAATVEEAHRKALELGKKEEGDSDGTFQWEGRDARFVLAGVRKINECFLNSDEKLGDGAEVTFSQMEVEDEEAFKKVVSGESVPVVYLE